MKIEGRILVTGGTGFVGHYLQETWHYNGEMGSLVRWLDHFDYDNSPWEEVHWDYIVHAANIPPTKVLQVAKRCNARVLYISSGAVLHRSDKYAEDKRRWELECFYSGTDVVCARLFTFYGGWILRDKTKAITQFIESARAGKPIHVWGDGSTVRTYMHGTEMACWLWAILFGGISLMTYEVGSDKPITMLELAQMVNRTFGNRSQIVLENRREAMPYYVPTRTFLTRQLLKT